MIKKFRDFIKPVPPVVITAIPVHGSHAQEKVNPPVKPTVVTAIPTHGKHSQPKDVNEEKFVKDKYILHHENGHIGDEEATHEHIEKEADKHMGALTEKQKDAAKAYTGHSRYLNTHLIEKSKGNHHYLDNESHFSKASADRIRENEKHLSKAMKKSKIKKDVVLYHGTKGFNPGKEAAKHPEGHIKLPAYTSTSHHKKNAFNFADPRAGKKQSRETHILRIHAKAGTHAIHVGRHSEFPGERETILHKNTVLKIHKKPDVIEHEHELYKPGSWSEKEKVKRRTYVWHAHIVSQHHDDDDK